MDNQVVYENINNVEIKMDYIFMFYVGLQI